MKILETSREKDLHVVLNNQTVYVRTTDLIGNFYWKACGEDPRRPDEIHYFEVSLDRKEELERIFQNKGAIRFGPLK
jgi:hypothetical protein